MKLLIFVVLHLTLICDCLYQYRREFNEDWNNFKKTYKKDYSAQEELVRRYLWERNMNKILAHNRLFELGTTSFRMGINQFSDWSQFEFSQIINCVIPKINRNSSVPVHHYEGNLELSENVDGRQKNVLTPVNQQTSEEFNLKNGSIPVSKSNGSAQLYQYNKNAQLAEEVDWRERNIVTEIKNQGQCGSCWAFSSTGALEGQVALKTGNLVSLSEQQLVDCSSAYGNYGCKGGFMDSAFQYIKNNNGIDGEDSYPYEAQVNQCRFQPNAAVTVSGYVDLPPEDEAALKDAVATVGPIAAAINSDSQEFRFYQGGVFDFPSCSQEINHAVLVIGYGTENGKDYWLVKNSWGTSWGIQGYIKMARNKNNQCAIASSASYPTV